MTGQEQKHPQGAAAAQAGREPEHCPVCGRPVETVIKRRKVLGIFVPEWVAGPCRNPECPAHVQPGV
ncbi:hypothetical protein [Streptomyces bambusae]|uniref:Uncharacterized protein n=1 Tax=Streptomyces bambusae TaxID=1550616 RepID=A0ABS6Z1I2_9ACTN|nr:hypothetical protein [Streptomyces bambusae]MBW5481602.1 hypothetical protein [Streptomyces bambusae]